MEDFLHIQVPVALGRPRGAHRFEAFSLKLARRLTFYRRAVLDQWVLLEADPAVIAFCERPGYIQFGGQRYLADFWVRYEGLQELVILSDSTAGGDAEADVDPLRPFRSPGSGRSTLTWRDGESGLGEEK